MSGRRRVLACPHNFEIGGSQMNAIELAQGVARDPRFEVSLFAPDGELRARADEAGLAVYPTKLREGAPSPARIIELARLARRMQVSLIHAYEWNVTVDAAYAGWGLGIPVLSTVLSMDYPAFLPRSVPVVLGTRQLHVQAAGEGREAYLLEPPVDTEEFAPGGASSSAIAEVRAECGVTDEQTLIVVVGRLAQRLKLDGLVGLAEAVALLDREVTLAIVGDGPERATVEAAAVATNRAVGREAIVMLGQRSRPHAWYAAADLVVGMGSSALRAMAVGKPVLVQGEQGFWRPATPENYQGFLEDGWYGMGGGGAVECARHLERMLAASPAQRDAWGQAGRALVVERYGLRQASETLADLYHRIARRRVGTLQRGVEALKATPPILAGRGAVRAYQLRDAVLGRRP